MKIKPVKKTPRGWLFDFKMPVSRIRFRRVISAPSKVHAIAIAEELYLEDYRKSSVGEAAFKSASPSISSAIDEYIETESMVRKSEGSVETDKASLAMFEAVSSKNIQVQRLSTVDLSRLVAAWKLKGYTVQTINRRMNSVKAFLNWCAARKWCDADLAKSLRHLRGKTREARPVSDEVFRKLLSAAGPELRTQMLIARATGLRRGEIAALEWSCIRLDSCTIQVGGTKDFATKSRKVRIVPFPEALKAEFESRLLHQSPRSKWLFPNSVGDASILPERITRAFGRAKRRAQVDDVVFHDLRATYATRVAELGAGDAVTAALLGHSSPAMARKYSRGVHSSVGKALVEESWDKLSEKLGQKLGRVDDSNVSVLCK